ncbi:MAG: IS1634 family transposase [Ardenticatenia bacterium]|nr:IS1634 family transposase [Ardenticatenia bacterium]
MAEIEIRTERVDDIPLLIHKQQKMGIPDVLNEVIQPHGNREGLSVGWLTTAWLSYILSEADHRMSEVEPWAEDHLQTLQALLPEPVGVKDFTDDRLADVLRYLSDDETWEEVEAQLSRRLIRVYNLHREPVRLDSTTVAVYHDEEGNTLFRHGYSKDHRPDLAQFKVMLGTLDPLGMPVATLVVAGNEADDGLYVPAIARSRPVVGQGGRLYVGDSKMAALATRAFVQAGGDYYLMPLPQTGEVPPLLAELLAQVWAKEQSLQPIPTPEREVTEGQRDLLALGFETTRRQRAEVDGQGVIWEERLLVVYSPTLARQARRGLEARLKRAEQELAALTPPRGRGRRQWEDLEALQAAVQRILKQRGVEGLLEVTYTQEVERRPIRKYGDRPARVEERVRYVVYVQRNREAIRAARRRLGWRLYATNAPPEVLSLPQAVWVYRGAPHIERNFRRLKGRPLGIRPLYVQREDHAQGMVRLLSLALRVLTLVEHVVREALQAARETLAGLYAGNPKRETARPTTERLLKAFHGITLSIVRLPERAIRHVTPLSALQRRILELLGLPVSIYEDLALTVDPMPP